MKEEDNWEKVSNGTEETPLTDNSHDEVFQELMTAVVRHHKWSARLMYYLQTGEFGLTDGSCKKLTELLGKGSYSLELAVQELTKTESWGN